VRHATKTDGAFAGSGRFFRLDPNALPVRHTDQGDAFILDRDRAVVRRDLHGIAATLDVPVSAYRGVAVRMFAEGEDQLRVVIELMHADPGLTLPLVVAGEAEEAAADWIAWGRALNLPLLFIEQDGTVSYPAGAGVGAAATPQLRRTGKPFRGRRSRFARRRKIGTFSAVERLEGREIIARD
jgi:hypothetical protein